MTLQVDSIGWSFAQMSSIRKYKTETKTQNEVHTRSRFDFTVVVLVAEGMWLRCVCVPV